MSKKKTGSAFAQAGLYLFPILGVAIGGSLLYLSFQSDLRENLQAARKEITKVKDGTPDAPGYEKMKPEDDLALKEARAKLPTLVEPVKIEPQHFHSQNESSFKTPFSVRIDEFETPIDDTPPPINNGNTDPINPPPTTMKATLNTAAKVWTGLRTEANAVYVFWDAKEYDPNFKEVSDWKWAVMRSEAREDGSTSSRWTTLAVLDSTAMSYIDISAQYGKKYVYSISQAVEEAEGQDIEGIKGSIDWTKTVTEEVPVKDADGNDVKEGDVVKTETKQVEKAVTMVFGERAKTAVVDPMLTRGATWYVTGTSAETISTISFFWLELENGRSSTWVRLSYPQANVNGGDAIGTEIGLTPSEMTAKGVRVHTFKDGAFVDVLPFSENDPSGIGPEVLAAFQKRSFVNFYRGITLSYVLAENGQTIIRVNNNNRGGEESIVPQEQILLSLADADGKAPPRVVEEEKPEGSGEEGTPGEGEDNTPDEEGGDMPEEGSGEGE